MPAPKSNQYAAKPDAQKASGFLHMRVNEADKRLWESVAGHSLSAWVIGVLNRAARRSRKSTAIPLCTDHPSDHNACPRSEGE